MLRLCIYFITICLPFQAFSTEIISVKPLTNSVLLVHFDEGYLLQAQNGEPYYGTDVIIANPLDINVATTLANYSISSTNDSNFGDGVLANALYRKTKPTAFATLCQGWDYIPYYDIYGCVNNDLDHADEHWIYLELADPLVSGNEYTLTMDSALSDQTYSFIFDEKTFKSDAIHVNNIGYSTEAELKYAYIYHWMGDGGSLDLSNIDGNTFEIVDEVNGNTVFTGAVAFRKASNAIETYQENPNETPNQNFLGAEVYECDFSSFNEPGSYYISIDGVGSSFPFNISCNALRLPFEMTMKGIFNNRSGIDIDIPNSDRSRPAPHNVISTPSFAGKLKYSSTTICEVSEADANSADSILWENGILGDLEESWGWYQDAGDWDGYISHFNVPAILMFTYEQFSENFVDNQLSIPESGNGLPDILDESRWLLRFYKRLKDETEDKAWTTGGVPGGRIFADLWGEDLGDNEILRGSWEDTDRQWVVSGEDAVTSFYYAAIAAHFQSILNSFNYNDPEGIDWETEAKNAYEWANDLYDAGAPCHDYEQFWARAYAAAALFKLDSDTAFEDDFVSSWNDADVQEWEGIEGMNALGPYMYYGNTNYTNTDIHTSIGDKIYQTGNQYLLDDIDGRACRWGGNYYYPMLGGHPTTPIVFEGLMAYAFARNENPDLAVDYAAYLHTTCDYFLGTNPLQMTWITGLGERSPTGVFHFDSFAAGDGSIKDGIVPYGPWRRDDAFPNTGPWDRHWPEQWVYPNISDWPGHERWFEQRTAPLVCEFTIHQNNLIAAAVYGALSGPYDCSEISGQANISVDTECIEIFPNPVDNFFTLQGLLPDYELSLIDSNGSVVKSLNNTGSEIIVNTNQLGSGMYFILISNLNNETICTKKIIKM